MASKSWWKLYKDREGMYRYSVRGANGQKLLASTEGYTRRARAVRNAMRFGAPQELKSTPSGVEVSSGA